MKNIIIYIGIVAVGLLAATVIAFVQIENPAEPENRPREPIETSGILSGEEAEPVDEPDVPNTDGNGVHATAPVTSALSAPGKPKTVEVPRVAAQVQSLPLTAGECEEVIAKSPFYRETSGQAVKRERALRDSGSGADADLLRAVSCVPHAIWLFGGNEAATNKKIEDGISKSDSKIPVFVIYNAPSYNTLIWNTGLGNGDAYLEWVGSVARKIGNAEAWVIVEPDALPLSHNLTEDDRAVRLGEIRSAVELLRDNTPNTRIYLDAGHSGWKIPDIISGYLLDAGIGIADGFALNVSNYQRTADEIAYGRDISRRVGGKPMVVDTGRNGNGPGEPWDWCNSRGRALGLLPATDTGEALVDAFLWVKPPGESDGTCNGGPPPGQFWLEYALELVRNAADD